MGSRGLVITPCTSPRNQSATQVITTSQHVLSESPRSGADSGQPRRGSLPEEERDHSHIEGTYEDIRQLAINIVLAFTLATVMVVVIAPIFGYKFDLILSSLNDLEDNSKALTDPEVVDP